MLIGVRVSAFIAVAFALGNSSCVYGSPPCGGEGQACCNSGARCGGGMTCMSGYLGSTCSHCGAQGEPCCDYGNPCGSGLGCAGGHCTWCGGPSEPCCGSVCTSGLACRLGGDAGASCVACGADGEPCCPGSLCTGTDHCTNLGLCGTCGAPGEPCCANAACSSPAHCETSPGTSIGRCTICGGAGEECCASGRCDSSTLYCSAGRCESCGAIRERCCARDQCPTSGVCVEGVCTDGEDAGAIVSSWSCATADCGAGAICVAFAAALCSIACTTDEACGLNGACSGGRCLPLCRPGFGDCDPYGGACLVAMTPYSIVSPGRVSVTNVCVPSCAPVSTSLVAGEPACASDTVCDPTSGECVAGEPPRSTLGAPCASDSDCAGQCIAETSPSNGVTGFFGGYCVSVARNPGPDAYAPGAPLPTSNCAPGGVAIPSLLSHLGDTLYCYAQCMSDCDCRVGYHCDHDPLRQGTPSPNGACLPVDCAIPGTTCPPGRICRTDLVGYLRYAMCGPTSNTVAGIDAGTLLDAANPGCFAPDSGDVATDVETSGSLDAGME